MRTNLIAGAWVAGETTFEGEPYEGGVETASEATIAMVDQAARAAHDAYAAGALLDPLKRAELLEAFAAAIDARGDALTETGVRETGLPAARLEGERGRTVGQLRMFAEEARKGDFLDARRDAALPDRAPLPRPDLRLIQRPIGPVAVFGASNFPLAFSVAGGDTASALAAGCPVVVKGHPAHPGLSTLVAEAADEAVKKTGAHSGVFSMAHGASIAVGEALARHPLIKAVGFTGSLRGGRALFDICAARPEPIPFFGELGSINPSFLMPAAGAARAAGVAEGWAGSLTMGAGQFCTNPGVVFVIDGASADAFEAAATAALDGAAAQTMLTSRIAAACAEGAGRIAAVAGIRTLVAPKADNRASAPAVFSVDSAAWRSNHILAEEVFGPVGVIVRVADVAEMCALADELEGQLTATLHLDEADHAAAAPLLATLERKAGRLLANGFPTGVEVCSSMMHGGPYPASTNASTTSVGTLAVRRFLRPVSFQNMPDALLPPELRGL